jgi:signal transduction histidine kinase
VRTVDAAPGPYRAPRAAPRDGDLGWLGCVRHAGEALAALSLDPQATREVAETLVREQADAADVQVPAFTLLALFTASRDPAYERAAPVEAAEGLLRLLFMLAPVRALSLWMPDQAGRASAVVHLGRSRPTAAVRHAALAALEERAPDGQRSFACLPIRVEGEVAAVLTARALPGGLDRVVRLADFLVEPLVSILSRAPALDRLPGRQQNAVAAVARRLRRVGLDLHDGPLQSVALLHGEIALLRSQLAEAPAKVELLDGRLADLQARASELQDELRELAISCESVTVPRLPIEARLHDLVAAFQRRGSIVSSLETDGDFSGLSASQELALFHIVQEALSNVREHSGAKLVRIRVRAAAGSVTARIVDDGNGFAFDPALVPQGGRRRLGVAGMIERARLLGGTVTVASARGGGTTIAIELPAWATDRASGAAQA